MLSEKQKQIRERRFIAGLKNPKKDKWAKRARPIRKTIDQRLSEKLSSGTGSSNIKIVRPSLLKRIWYWIRSLW